MPKVKAIIFDMDGTIFDTERLGIKCWKEACLKLGFKVPEEILYKKIGLNSDDSRKLMENECGKEFDYDTAKKVKRDIIKNYIAKNGTPVKEYLDYILNYIKEMDIRTALATSRGMEMTKLYLENAKLNLENRFDVIVTGDMVTKGKPNPEIFMYVARKLNANPAECIVIEDSINGIIAAKRADMMPVMIPDIEKPDDRINQILYAKLHGLNEIKDILN